MSKSSDCEYSLSSISSKLTDRIALQKEPKLERARKIPEWDEYDREVAAFTKKLQGKQAGDVSGQVGSADDLEALAVVQEPIVSDGDTTMEDGTSEIRIADEL